MPRVVIRFRFPKGHRPRLLDKQQILEIKRLVEENNSLSAREIMMKLGIECHLGVIYRALEELGFTFKKKEIKASQRENPDIQKERSDWADLRDFF